MLAIRYNARPWVMWFFPLAFFAYQFILRLWPSLLMPQIMEQFTIDATAFGFLSAIYYFGYAGMQIPIAVCLDYYGPKIVVSLCILICGFATMLFTYTDSWPLALLGRFLIGVGSAAGFLGTSKAIALWFPRNRYSSMVGLSFSFGLLGAIYGGKPVSFLVESYSWQSIATSMAGFGVFLGVLMLVFFKNPEQTAFNCDKKMTLREIKCVFHAPSLIFLAIANLLMVGSLEGFADVWGVNYLVEAYQFSKSDAAGLISFIFVGMLFGGPLLAFFSHKWGSYPVIIGCSLGMASLFLVLLLARESFNGVGLSCLFFVIGLLCCYQVIVFEAGSNLVSSGLLSVTIAFLNCINMLGGSFFHTTIGFLMDLFWTGNWSNGVKIYTIHSYFYALLAIPFFALVGGVIVYGLSKKARQYGKERALF